jgi:hypothetical protein
MEVYLNTDLDLDSLAKVIARLINVRERNRTAHQAEQRRRSVNRGGIYYLFELIGLELLLLQNVDDVRIPERAGWRYYLLVSGHGVRRELAEPLCHHLADLLRREGILAEVDDLAA